MQSGFGHRCNAHRFSCTEHPKGAKLGRLCHCKPCRTLVRDLNFDILFVLCVCQLDVHLVFNCSKNTYSIWPQMASTNQAGLQVHCDAHIKRYLYLDHLGSLCSFACGCGFDREVQWTKRFPGRWLSTIAPRKHKLRLPNSEQVPKRLRRFAALLFDLEMQTAI